MALSNMMKHYLSVKDKYKDCLIFYRLGDFYEMFFDDAVKASQLLDLTLTGRDCGLEKRAPMCGVPYHAVDAYIQKLVSQGEKVAICEQLEDPSTAKGMVERAGENARLSGVESGIRYIIDDCAKFVAREIRRGNRYDGIIMDPPSYGRGPGGEMWKIERDLFGFVKECAKLLSDNPLFFLINSYTTGLQPAVLKNVLTLALDGKKGEISAYEVGISTDEGIALPCGASGLFVGEV